PLPPPPPPPPLPPRPPPLPPPPPAPGLFPSLNGPGFAKGQRRRSRMRNFNWETLPKQSVIGKHNIWTADKTDGEYELDTDHIEELFSHKQVQQQLKTQNVKGLSTPATGGETVSILNSKRSMNIGIFLKQFKSLEDLIEEIKSGSSHSFGPGKLRDLCKLLPDDGEVKQLVNFKGDHSAVPEADRFMLMLVKIPSYEKRLSNLVLKEEFFPLMEEMKGLIGTLTAAGRLLESDHLHSIIRLVLKTGNYMNAGGYAGSAIGFRMSSLLKLVDTKANKPGMNLMHYVVMQAQKADMALLNFPDQLKHIEDAAMNKGDIEAEFKRQMKKVQDAKTNTLKHEDLKVQMEDFLKEAEVCLTEIETELQELQSISDSVAEYFCEDPTKFKLEECCSVFNSFCEKFMRAMQLQENKAREMAEVKRRQRDRLQNAAKRRSTATCSSRDKEMDGVALESVLQNFLTNRNSRRRSGRPSSTFG
uniref:FH2 domain containing 4 n=1 Tax=Acanthochromis polyacanthus TaxID=80966 RepID=A0A3Q1FHA8_9TELE